MTIIFLMILQLLLIFVLLGVGFAMFSGIWSMWSGAPYVPMAQRHIRGLLEFGRVGPEDVVYDLGCGDGRVLRTAVREFGVRRAIGYDIAPWPYMKARILNWWHGFTAQISIRRQSFMTADLHDATFVYLYLFPKLVDHAARRIEDQTCVGTRVLSASFPVDLTRHPGLKLREVGKVGTITAYLYERV